MRKIVTFTIAALLASSAFAAGEVYRWKDSKGIWHFSDQPQPGAEQVRGVRRPAQAAPAPPPAAPVAAASLAQPAPVTAQVASEVRQEAATAKAEQCKKATEAYQQAITARRIVKKDEAGKDVFLTSAEIDAARLQARSVRDEACGP